MSGSDGEAMEESNALQADRVSEGIRRRKRGIGGGGCVLEVYWGVGRGMEGEGGGI